VSTTGRCRCGYRLPPARVKLTAKTTQGGAAFRAVCAEHEYTQSLIVTCPDCGNEWTQDQRLGVLPSRYAS